MQIECLLPKAKVTFTKFGERYCMNANYHPRAYYGSKYDGETLQRASDCQIDPGDRMQPSYMLREGCIKPQQVSAGLCQRCAFSMAYRCPA